MQAKGGAALDSNLLHEIAAKLALKRIRRRWCKVIAGFACVAIFAVTYALILPAITMETKERQLTCSYHVHEHTEDCRNEKQELICGKADFVVHIHSEDCYEADGQLCCSLPEIPAHEHSDSCYEEGELRICELNAVLHRHSEACYNEEGDRICSQLEVLEHIHGEGCFTEEISMNDAEISGETSVEADSQTAYSVDATAVSALSSTGEALFTAADSYGSKTATVTIGEVSVTATISFAYQPTAVSKLSVAAESFQGPRPGAHGELISGEVLTIRIFNSNGEAMSYQNPIEFMVTKTTGFTEGTKYYVPSANQQDMGTPITGTTFQLQAPIPNESLEILTGQWKPSSDTLISTGGAYTIEYILKNYNVFVETHFKGTHIVGPVAAESTEVSLGGLSTGGIYPHLVPDYIGDGKSVITNNLDMKVYFSKNAMEGVVGPPVGPYGQVYYDYYFAEQFIDWNAAMAALQAEANGFSGKSVDLSLMQNGELPLAIGGLYELTAEELSSINYIDIIGDFSSGRDTLIIVKDDGSVKLPTLRNNGKEIASIESGMLGSVVFLLPNAAVVTGNAVSGHIVAPRAEITLTGGYFNGCVIGHSLRAEAEGHMWPYNGYIFTTSQGFKAWKKLDGEEISDVAVTFDFVLEELTGGEWCQVQKTENHYSGIVFDEIVYDTIGTYWYRIREERGLDTAYSYDPAQYILRVEITQNENGKELDNHIDYYKAENADLVILTANGEAVELTDLTELHPVEGGANLELLTFYNQSSSQPGFVLPSTGGCGTDWYTLSGAAIAISAILLSVIIHHRKGERVS